MNQLADLILAQGAPVHSLMGASGLAPGSVPGEGSGGPLDLWQGLPVHALVVHAAVVLLPLSSLGLILIVVVPRLRRSIGWLVMLGLAVCVGVAFVTQESGEALTARVGRPADHADLGQYVLWVSAAELVVGALWYISATASSRRARKRSEQSSGTSSSAIALDPVTGLPTDSGSDTSGATRSRAVPVLGVLSVLVAVASLGLVYRVGHTGTEAAWNARIAATEPTSPPALTASPSATASPTTSSPTTESPTATASPSRTPTAQPSGPTPMPSASLTPSQGTMPSGDQTAFDAITYSMVEVGAHNRAQSCWAVVSGRVYDLTSWIPAHPATEQAVTSLCGTDATASIAGKAGALLAADDLAPLQIGTLG